MSATRVICSALIVISAAFVASAYAENWVAIDGGKIYADSESAKRSGDIATITVRDAKGTLGTMSVDCKRNLLLTAKEPTSIAGSDLLTLACKRWYEFWK